MGECPKTAQRRRPGRSGKRPLGSPAGLVKVRPPYAPSGASPPGTPAAVDQLRPEQQLGRGQARQGAAGSGLGYEHASDTSAGTKESSPRAGSA